MGVENSGRRPKPTALKLLLGTVRKDRLNALEPKPPVGEVQIPEGISPAARVVWGEIAPVCLYMGTLTAADTRPFWMMCEMQATWELNCKVKGTPEFNVRLERELANTMRPYYEYFGMTPSSRARISVPKKTEEEPQSKWAGSLK